MASRKAQRVSNLAPVVVLALITVIGIVLMNRNIDSRARSAADESPTREAPALQSPATPEADREPAARQDWLERSDDSLTGSLFKAVLYTFLIVAAIIAGAFGLRYLRRDRFQQSGSTEIRILGRRYLNPKQSLAIIRVRNRELLVGITDQSIQLLYDFTAPNSDGWSDREREIAAGGKA